MSTDTLQQMDVETLIKLRADARADGDNASFAQLDEELHRRGAVGVEGEEGTPDPIVRLYVLREDALADGDRASAKELEQQIQALEAGLTPHGGMRLSDDPDADEDDLEISIQDDEARDADDKADEATPDPTDDLPQENAECPPEDAETDDGEPVQDDGEQETPPASRAAAKLAAEADPPLDLADVEHDGPTITKPDVQRHLANRPGRRL